MDEMDCPTARSKILWHLAVGTFSTLMLGCLPAAAQDTGRILPAWIDADQSPDTRLGHSSFALDAEKLGYVLAEGELPSRLHFPSPQDHHWASLELPFPVAAPKLGYAATIHRHAREYASGSWFYQQDKDRRLDAVAAVDLHEGSVTSRTLLNYHHRIDGDQDFGLALVATEQDDLSNVALAGQYVSRFGDGTFYQIWLGATRTTPDQGQGQGLAARVSLGIDLPVSNVKLTFDRYTSAYYPVAKPTSSHLPGTWGITLDASHLLQFSNGPIDEVYFFFTPFMRTTDEGRLQGRGHDLLVSATSYQGDYSFDLYHSQASYLTRESSTGIWSDSYSVDRFLEATTSLCNSCRWRPSLTFSDAVFTGLSYRLASLSIHYEASESLTATLSAGLAKDEGQRSTRQELLLRWTPSEILSASLRGSISAGELDRVRIKVDAELNRLVSTSIVASTNGDNVALAASVERKLPHGAAIIGSLSHDGQDKAEISGRIIWNF